MTVVLTTGADEILAEIGEKLTEWWSFKKN